MADLNKHKKPVEVFYATSNLKSIPIWLLIIIIILPIWAIYYFIVNLGMSMMEPNSKLSAPQQGFQIAQYQGCFACHGPAGNKK